MIAPGDIILVPQRVQSVAALRAFVELEALMVEHRFHELVVIWNRQDPANEYALVLRMPKRTVQECGWPFLIDQETRVLVMGAPGTPNSQSKDPY